MLRYRRLPLSGLYNARDLGGFPTADGGATKFGIFIRTEATCDLPEADVAALKAYGVTTAIDLRGSGEKGSRPSCLKDDPDITYLEKPLFNEAAIFDKNDRDASRPDNPPPPKVVDHLSHDWGQQYIKMAEESRAWALEVLDIAATCPGALLYHCTTGKDRTGVLTCYLLSICGVAAPDIAADYCVSQVFLEPVFERMRSGRMNLGPAPKDAPVGGPKMDDSFFKTPAEAIMTLITYLNETYGGVVNYLSMIGVTQATMDRIKAKFVEY